MLLTDAVVGGRRHVSAVVPAALVVAVLGPGRTQTERDRLTRPTLRWWSSTSQWLTWPDLLHTVLIDLKFLAPRGTVNLGCCFIIMLTTDETAVKPSGD